MKYINLNGSLQQATEAAIAYDNRAFRYGYGLFETMLYRDGAIQLQRYHWERLFVGMKQLCFSIPSLMTEEWLEKEVSHTVKKNGSEQLCRVRLQVYGGSGGLYDAYQKPAYIIECFPLDENILNLNENGLVTGIAQGLNKSPDTLANLKSCNALIYAMAAQQAKEHKWNDTLILNNTGNVIESTIANIFAIKEGIVYTPPLSEGCVAGVMRRYITEQLAAHNISIIEKPLSPDLLATADEVFLTNAIRRVKWVQTINDTHYRLDLTKFVRHTLF